MASNGERPPAGAGRCKSCGTLAKKGKDFCGPCLRAKRAREKASKPKTDARPPKKGDRVEASTVHPHGRVKRTWKRIYRGPTTRPEDYLAKGGWTPSFPVNPASSDAETGDTGSGERQT